MPHLCIKFSQGNLDNLYLQSLKVLLREGSQEQLNHLFPSSNQSLLNNKCISKVACLKLQGLISRNLSNKMFYRNNQSSQTSLQLLINLQSRHKLQQVYLLGVMKKLGAGQISRNTKNKVMKKKRSHLVKIQMYMTRVMIALQPNRVTI